MLYLAIDQHRKQLTVNLRNEQGDVLLKRQVSTEWNRVREFLEDLRQRSQAEGGFVAILEVCGFNDWLLKLLAEYGCRETILVQPEKRSKHKTDRRDAEELGQVLWVNRQRMLGGKRVQGVRRVCPASPQEAEDRQITWMRKRLGTLRTRTINKIKHILRKHNLEQECPTKGIDTIHGKKWLTQVSLGPVDRLEMDQLLTQWNLWEEQIKATEAEIVPRQARSETAAILATIPGCRAYGSLALASRIGPIERFVGRGSLANYWGLTPGCRNSGEATERLGSIAKRGSTMARFMLGQLVLHVLRRDAWMKAWFGKIKRRRGAKIARVAVMRRLADIIEQMVKNHEAYVLGGPSQRKPQAKPADFRRHGKVSKGAKKTASGEKSRQRPDAPLAHLGPAIPRRVASPQSPTPLHRTKTIVKPAGRAGSPAKRTGGARLK
jgi:transposase